MNILDFRFHDLRHTAASWLRMKGADIHTVAQLLGHRDLRMAARYQHLAPAFLAKAVATLDSVFSIPRYPSVTEPKQLAGGEAERLVRGRHDHQGARSDYGNAADYAFSMCAGEEAETKALLKYAQLRTRRLVAGDAWQQPIRAIAAALLEKKTLSSVEVKELYFCAFNGRRFRRRLTRTAS